MVFTYNYYICMCYKEINFVFACIHKLCISVCHLLINKLYKLFLFVYTCIYSQLHKDIHTYNCEKVIMKILLYKIIIY